MPSDEHSGSAGDEDVQPIPEEEQDITLEELTEEEYEVIDRVETENTDDTSPACSRRYGSMLPPGRFLIKTASRPQGRTLAKMFIEMPTLSGSTARWPLASAMSKTTTITPTASANFTRGDTDPMGI